MTTTTETPSQTDQLEVILTTLLHLLAAAVGPGPTATWAERLAEELPHLAEPLIALAEELRQLHVAEALKRWGERMHARRQERRARRQAKRQKKGKPTAPKAVKELEAAMAAKTP